MKFGYKYSSSRVKKALISKGEKESALCADCGKPALYRLYTPQGRNIGACAEHRGGLFKKAGWTDK